MNTSLAIHNTVTSKYPFSQVLFFKYAIQTNQIISAFTPSELKTLVSYLKSTSSYISKFLRCFTFPLFNSGILITCFDWSAVITSQVHDHVNT